MARQVRVQYAGATYHVLCRGDRREAIFLTDRDRESFVETLAEVCERTGFRIHGYVLMGNHYHLLLETPEPNLVEGMKWFQGTYTQRFNARNRLSGHLFQGRYKAILVDPEEPAYFRTLSDYIHLNPARAGLLAGKKPSLLNYRWSSYPCFVRAAPLEPWLIRHRVFSSYGLLDESARSRRRYAGRVRRRVAEILNDSSAGEEEWRTVRQGWYLGSEAFRNQIMEKAAMAVQGRERRSFERTMLKCHDEKAARVLLQRGLQELDLKLADAQLLRQNDPRKQGLAWLVKSQTVVEDAWILSELEMGHRSNISRAVNAFRSPADRERKRVKKQLHKCTD